MKYGQASEKCFHCNSEKFLWRSACAPSNLLKCTKNNSNIHKEIKFYMQTFALVIQIFFSSSLRFALDDLHANLNADNCRLTYFILFMCVECCFAYDTNWKELKKLFFASEHFARRFVQSICGACVFTTLIKWHSDN